MKFHYGLYFLAFSHTSSALLHPEKQLLFFKFHVGFFKAKTCPIDGIFLWHCFFFSSFQRIWARENCGKDFPVFCYQIFKECPSFSPSLGGEKAICVHSQFQGSIHSRRKEWAFSYSAEEFTLPQISLFLISFSTIMFERIQTAHFLLVSLKQWTISVSQNFNLFNFNFF